MKFTFNVPVNVDIPDDIIDDLVEDVRQWGNIHSSLMDFLRYEMGYGDNDSAELDALYDELRKEIERRLKEDESNSN